MIKIPDTYSAKVFSTSSTNFPLCLAKATSSSEYTMLRFVLCMSGLMPSASARRAFRFAISHSFVQCGPREVSRSAELEVLRSQHGLPDASTCTSNCDYCAARLDFWTSGGGVTRASAWMLRRKTRSAGVYSKGYVENCRSKHLPNL